MKFTDYCEENNIQLLTEDKKFLIKHIQKLPKEARLFVLKHYCQHWLSAMQNTDKIETKQNLGRRAANLWLLEQTTLSKMETVTNPTRR